MYRLIPARGNESSSRDTTAASISIRLASAGDTDAVSDVLLEAARWLEGRGIPLWPQEEQLPNRLAHDVATGMYVLAEMSGAAIGTARFQLEDAETWPDLPPTEATLIHRLAVRRSVAGGEVSSAMLRWALDRTRQLGRRYLRFDCDAGRTRLKAVYERLGFRHHSDRQVGRYFVSRYELDAS